MIKAGLGIVTGILMLFSILSVLSSTGVVEQYVETPEESTLGLIGFTLGYKIVVPMWRVGEFLIPSIDALDIIPIFFAVGVLWVISKSYDLTVGWKIFYFILILLLAWFVFKAMGQYLFFWGAENLGVERIVAEDLLFKTDEKTYLCITDESCFDASFISIISLALTLILLGKVIF